MGGSEACYRGVGRPWVSSGRIYGRGRSRRFLGRLHDLEHKGKRYSSAEAKFTFETAKHKKFCIRCSNLAGGAGAACREPVELRPRTSPRCTVGFSLQQSGRQVVMARSTPLVGSRFTRAICGPWTDCSVIHGD